MFKEQKNLGYSAKEKYGNEVSLSRAWEATKRNQQQQQQKNQIEIRELESKINELKLPLERIKSISEWTEERISELEVILSEEQNEEQWTEPQKHVGNHEGH